ncbi:NAD-dependent epimerase/dehydratase family protein [Desulfomonile tiedjei]|uniref:Nucleoside-diphosphate-sugar epimerase n=1 Tax=Desulfomonile tiedjei (strain ATCC 49306 / DSM 6799 / DCB-1) TaxID=706587 RepID=I4BZZ9_DESTA|nr:SDR family NAD(P)-dependent oxidoreductase [Desulfomonile tiedjei]AFM22890.1 nucleoside-diphosphate-sugar epimerase [Desulfomonile tiedjei DSM 6799]
MDVSVFSQHLSWIRETAAMRRILITGASGFVGANLARTLLASGHEVHLLLREHHLDWRLQDIRKHVSVTRADLRDADLLFRAVKQIRPEWIFHLAAYGAYSFQTNIQQTFETNLLGTANLVQACLETGFEVLVNTGSSSEYGFKDHAPSEGDLPEPNSYYAVSKVSATMFCRYTAESKEVRIPTLRLYSAYGPYEEPKRLMPTLIRCGLEKKFPPLVNPETARDYVYIDDVVHAYILVAQTSGREFGAIYNVGTGRETKLSEVVKIARDVLDIPGEPQWGSMESRIWDTSTWVADNRKIRDELGWHPKYSFEQGFRLMVRWFEENPKMLNANHVLSCQDRK